MIEVHRIVENQAHVYGYKVTLDKDEAEALEMLLELSKPKFEFGEYDELICTPFRYPLPVPPIFAARFRPPFFMKNAFYCSEKNSTSIYEYSYHFMRQRVHLQSGKRNPDNEVGKRTKFTVVLTESPNLDVCSHADLTLIMSKTDYKTSHELIEKNKDVSVVRYPSARDPQHGICFAVFELERLEKEPKTETNISFLYDYYKKSIFWIEEKLTVTWTQVS